MCVSVYCSQSVFGVVSFSNFYIRTFCSYRREKLGCFVNVALEMWCSDFCVPFFLLLCFFCLTDGRSPNISTVFFLPPTQSLFLTVSALCPSSPQCNLDSTVQYKYNTIIVLLMLVRSKTSTGTALSTSMTFAAACIVHEHCLRAKLQQITIVHHTLHYQQVNIHHLHPTHDAFQHSLPMTAPGSLPRTPACLLSHRAD